ncbi:hypothetical protein BCR42DRAFT_397655 [Absidia repens]|uniref:Uncharacterized protein n=1 Tax=Absidia repens TaxID=90262 RepID=A0A1X2I0D7_9FUNG|nr:hypothetical protein BCR42DRAFT_397655 [Absidia repens]
MGGVESLFISLGLTCVAHVLHHNGSAHLKTWSRLRDIRKILGNDGHMSYQDPETLVTECHDDPVEKRGLLSASSVCKRLPRQNNCHRLIYWNSCVSITLDLLLNWILLETPIDKTLTGKKIKNKGNRAEKMSEVINLHLHFYLDIENNTISIILDHVPWEYVNRQNGNCIPTTRDDFVKYYQRTIIE